MKRIQYEQRSRPIAALWAFLALVLSLPIVGGAWFFLSAWMAYKWGGGFFSQSQPIASWYSYASYGSILIALAIEGAIVIWAYRMVRKRTLKP